MQTPTYSLITHSGQARIKVSFAHNPVLNQQLKTTQGARWSQTLKSWHIPDTIQNRLLCGLPPLIVAATGGIPATKQPQQAKAVALLCPQNQTAMQLFLQQLHLKAYSQSTVRTYSNEFAAFLQTLKNNNAAQLSTQRVKDYLQYCHTTLRLSENTIHSRINALKFYYEQVLKREKFFWEIPRPKKQLQNPCFFNQDEITKLLNGIANLKHKTMLMLAYSSGLRVSEVVALKTMHIDSNRMSISILQAKGKKDRLVVLSPVLLVMLREYWKIYKPAADGFLFEGQNKGEPYSSRSLQQVLTAAKQRAGILKPGSIHALRHSFATHLLDKGTDVTLIMKLLGHNDLKTTLRYLHVTNRDMLQIISPLDGLKLDKKK